MCYISSPFFVCVKKGPAADATDAPQPSFFQVIEHRWN
jgi:hypothetical protein